MGTVFSTGDIRGRVDETLTTDYVWNVGKAVADWLQDEGSIIIAKNASANEQTVHALIEGLLLQGRDVVDSGVGEEQLVASSVIDNKAAGGVYVAHDDLQNIEIISLFNGQGVRITAENGLFNLSELVDAGNFVPAAEKGTLSTEAID